MTDERVTLRLQRMQLEQIDLLVMMGEFDDRSSAIRQAIRELVDVRRSKVLQKADEIAKLQQAASLAGKTDAFMKK